MGGISNQPWPGPPPGILIWTGFGRGSTNYLYYSVADCLCSHDSHSQCKRIKKITERGKSIFHALICEVIRDAKHKQVGTRGSLHRPRPEWASTPTPEGGTATLLTLECPHSLRSSALNYRPLSTLSTPFMREDFKVSWIQGRRIPILHPGNDHWLVNPSSIARRGQVPLISSHQKTRIIEHDHDPSQEDNSCWARCTPELNIEASRHLSTATKWLTSTKQKGIRMPS